MKVAKLSMFFLIVLVAVQLSEAAEESKPKEEKRFSDELSFALVNTTGNSDTLALAGKNEMKYKFTDKWTGSWVAGALYNKSDGDKTAEKYFTDLRAEYAISERWYAYGLGSTNGPLPIKPNFLRGWSICRVSKTAAPGN
jgi:putative salt-induced outer membrane protein YdiY